MQDGDEQFTINPGTIVLIYTWASETERILWVDVQYLHMNIYTDEYAE